MTQITLLDGGLGQELVRRSRRPATPLWATQVMIDSPDLVSGLHADFATAGATVATTNTYALHRDRLRGGRSNHYAGAAVDLPDLEADFERLLVMALDCVDPVRPACRIAGSIGPLVASYRPDLHPDEATAVPLYAEFAQHLAPRVDILLVETVASLSAARAALRAGRTTDRPVWLCFTVDDTDGTRLRSGERVAEAARIAADADAALINCSAPEAMPAALDAMGASDRPLGAYANAFTHLTDAFVSGGTTAADLQARTDLGPEAYAAHALEWVARGATIVGGCCEVGPAHIAEVARQLRASGHSIV